MVTFYGTKLIYNLIIKSSCVRKSAILNVLVVFFAHLVHSHISFWRSKNVQNKRHVLLPFSLSLHFSSALSIAVSSAVYVQFELFNIFARSVVETKLHENKIRSEIRFSCFKWTYYMGFFSIGVSDQISFKKFYR